MFCLLKKRVIWLALPILKTGENKLFTKPEQCTVASFLRAEVVAKAPNSLKLLVNNKSNYGHEVCSVQKDDCMMHDYFLL